MAQDTVVQTEQFKTSVSAGNTLCMAVQELIKDCLIAFMFERGKKVALSFKSCDFNSLFIAFMSQLHKNDLCCYLPSFILVQASFSPIHNSRQFSDNPQLYCIILMLPFCFSCTLFGIGFENLCRFFIIFFGVLSKDLFIEREVQELLQYFMT